MSKKIVIKKAKNSYTNSYDYYLYFGEYYFVIGVKSKLIELFNILKAFNRGKINNSNGDFKIWYTAKYIYIKSKMTEKYIGIPKDAVDSLILYMNECINKIEEKKEAVI